MSTNKAVKEETRKYGSTKVYGLPSGISVSGLKPEDGKIVASHIANVYLTNGEDKYTSAKWLIDNLTASAKYNVKMSKGVNPAKDKGGDKIFTLNQSGKVIVDYCKHVIAVFEVQYEADKNPLRQIAGSTATAKRGKPATDAVKHNFNPSAKPAKVAKVAPAEVAPAPAN